jgi:hypothetical protein
VDGQLQRLSVAFSLERRLDISGEGLSTFFMVCLLLMLPCVFRRSGAWNYFPLSVGQFEWFLLQSIDVVGRIGICSPLILSLWWKNWPY